MAKKTQKVNKIEEENKKGRERERERYVCVCVIRWNSRLDVYAVPAPSPPFPSQLALLLLSRASFLTVHFLRVKYHFEMVKFRP